jgi:GMP synthase (glutamine-hydrolysing)
LGATVEYLDPTLDWNWDDSIHVADLIAILGGPIAVYDQDRYPIVRQALSLIEKRMRTGSPLLGICLGAQMIAKVMGARVYPGKSREIGWGNVGLTQEGHQSSLRFLSEGTNVLHWHGDTFDLPGGASRLAFTPQTANQAFSFGTNVLGIQFHAEVCVASFEQWLIGHAAELEHAGLDVNQMRASCPADPISQTGASSKVLLDWVNGWDVAKAKRVARATLV